MCRNYLIAVLLIFVLGLNSIARVSSENVLSNTFLGNAHLKWEISGEFGRRLPIVHLLPKDVNASVIREVTTYLGQFEGKCFAENTSIGDPRKFEAAINRNIYRIIVGTEAIALVNKRPDSQAYHDSTGFSGQLLANIVFPFDPDSLKIEDAFKKRQTMVHELTHHIEWLNGVKADEKPMSERNTDYQERVVDALKDLAQIEEDLKSNESTVENLLADYRAFETRMRELEAGGAADGNLPDLVFLQQTTGFDTTFSRIDGYYSSGTCGKDLKNLAALNRLLPKLLQVLQIEPQTIELGETVTAEAVLLSHTPDDPEAAEVTIPAEFEPEFSWKLPNGEISRENPLSYTPEEVGDYVIPVELTISFNNQNFVLASGDFILNVNSDPAVKESGWSFTDAAVVSDNPDIEQAIQGYLAGPYQVRGKVVPGLSSFTWQNPNREGNPKTSMSITWTEPPASLSFGEEIQINGNGFDNGSSSTAAEGDWISFGAALYGSNDDKNWSRLSTEYPLLFVNPGKNESRPYRLRTPTEKWKKLIVQINAGSMWWGKYVNYTYESNN